MFTQAEEWKKWLADPQHANSLWLGRHCVIVAWAGLLAATLSPPHGWGGTVCWFLNSTGVPCPGCGLTRSLSCGLRGLWLESWHYHPMGLLILALFGFTVAQSLLPCRARARLLERMRAHAPLCNAAYLAFVVAFLCFGVVRAVVCLSHPVSAFFASTVGG